MADLDILDRTPLLDIKPYVPIFNAYVQSAPGGVDQHRVDRQVADNRFHRGHRSEDASKLGRTEPSLLRMRRSQRAFVARAGLQVLSV